MLYLFSVYVSLGLQHEIGVYITEKWAVDKSFMPCVQYATFLNAILHTAAIIIILRAPDFYSLV